MSVEIRREYTEAGRWSGQLTQKPLPESDPSIAELSPRARKELAGIWLSRAAMERRVADSFTVIAQALERQGAPASLVQLAQRSIDDEYRHAELSRLVASRFAGRELPSPALLSLEVPAHRGASEALRDTLHVVGQCILNETTATAFLETCKAHATGSLAKHALRELLSDEVDHGRIGWAYLASTSTETRRQVGQWLLPMAYLNLRLWKEESPVDPDHLPELSAHGAPPGELIHEALVDALTTLILPGFQQLGVPTAAVERWVAQGAFTDRAPTDLLD
jgi:hypothetical protein